MATLEELSSPVRELAHHSAMTIFRSNMSHAAQTVAISAIPEGTMAAALEILGARDAFGVIQPLVDQVLNPAIAATLERN